MNNNVSNDITVNPRSVIVISLLSIAYLLLSWLLVGYKPDQVFLMLLCNVLFYSSKISRKFLFAYSTFLVYWIIFDYMKAIPNYKFNVVHMEDLYNAEKHLFGIHFNGKLLTPNEYLKLKSTTFLDVMSGIFYLCWIPVPFAFGLYLFFTNRRQCLYFTLSFVLINLVGFVVYYAYPAAPPWYIQQYGFVFHPNTHEGIAGLSRFDDYFHVHIFKGLYTKGSNVFAAMPSLHSAKLASVIFGIVTVGIWFGAVYTSHHYVLDVMAGILCAIAGISIFNLFLAKWGWFARFVDNYEKLVRK